MTVEECVAKLKASVDELNKEYQELKQKFPEGNALTVGVVSQMLGLNQAILEISKVSRE